MAAESGGDEEEEGPQWRVRQTLRKSKSKKFRKPKQLDARQYAMFFGVVFVVLWGLVVTFLLLNLGIMYNFSTVPGTRKEYGVKGSAAWAKQVASEDLMQAIEVWDIINASFTGLVYRSPTDYTNLANVLSPAFDTLPTLHSVELAFSDRPAAVSLTRKQGKIFVGPSSTMQSNSNDCFLMGVEGCVGQPTTMEAPRPYWYVFGEQLREAIYGGIFYWWTTPELVIEEAPDGNGDILTPAVRLIFKASFPTYVDAAGKNVVAIGRITLKLSALGGGRLADERLGEDGAVYLADAGGVMMASQDVFDVLGVANGQVQFKYLWEVGKSWTRAIRSAFAGSAVVEMAKEDDGTFVAVEPLPYPLERFAIVVVAPSREPFTNVALALTSALASIVAPFPYAVAAVIASLFIITQCVSTLRKTDGSVGLDAFSSAKGARASITDTVPVGYGANKDAVRHGGLRNKSFGGQGSFGKLKSALSFG